MRLVPEEYNALRWAVSEAAAWRGSLVGNPDRTELEAFDRRVLLARHALAKIKPTPRCRCSAYPFPHARGYGKCKEPRV